MSDDGGDVDWTKPLRIAPVVTTPPASLAKDERGLIISSLELLNEHTRDGGRRELRYRTGRIPSPEELRRALLLWDKIDIPISGEEPPNPELTFLIDAGALSRSPQPLTYAPVMELWGTPQFQYRTDYSPEAVSSNYLSTYRRYEESQPGQWAMGIGKGRLRFPETQTEPGRGLLVRLHNAIPIPDRDVPLNELLEFRRNRRAELLSLRAAMDSLYIEILDAPDRPLAEVSRLAELDKALNDLTAVSKSAPFRTQAASLEATFNAQTIGVGVAVSATAATAGMEPVAIALAGVATTILASVKATFGIKYALQSKSAFQYAISMRDDL